MSKFINAMRTQDTYTENGMLTNSTSLSNIVDLFFKQGGWRGYPEAVIEQGFAAAMAEDPLMAVRCMFYCRDIRGGQGERRTFRIMFRYLCYYHPDIAKYVFHFVPEYGRWDDLFVALDTEIENEVMDFLRYAVEIEKSALAAKWIPREGKAEHKIADKLRHHWFMTWKDYRKALSSATNVVENLMCAKRWSEINYSHVPSVASHKYRKAFLKHDEGRYRQWLEDITNGKATVNAGAIYPHTLANSLYYTPTPETVKLAEAQWKALPDFVPEGIDFIPVCDVSGSMNGTPMDVSVALGIYLSERNKTEAFKDAFITFSGNPRLHFLKGKLHQRVQQLRTADWGRNTNLQAVFELILEQARRHNLSQEDMPSYVIILSDMQFDNAVGYGNVTALQMIDRMYEQAGYIRPQLIFWNLRTSIGTPVTIHDSGTALVSGFSPSLMKYVLKGQLTPIAMMLSVLENERYKEIAF